MSRAARSRAVKKHETAIPLERAAAFNEVEMAEDDEQQSAEDSELSEDEEDAAPEAEENMDGTETVKQPTKKSKKKDKRAALMRKLAESAIPVSPYSKSHNRRMKKKAKESMKLGAITAALEEALPEEPSLAGSLHNKPKTAELHSVLESERKKQTKSAPPPAAKKPTSPGKIGADTSRKNLSAKQRQKMLQTEKNRLPAILAHKSFAASPFETIRLHAQNTVVPLEKSRRG